MEQIENKTVDMNKASINTSSNNSQPTFKFTGGFGCVVVLAALLCGLIYGVKSCTPHDNNKIEFSPITIEGKLCHQWEFFSFNPTAYGRCEGLTGEYVCEYHGKISIGVDLSNCRDFVSKEGDVLVVRAPQLSILNETIISDDLTKVIKNFPFGANDKDRAIAKNNALEKMIDDASKKVEQAEAKGRKEIESQIRSLGYKGPIRITFAKDMTYAN